MYNHHGQTLYTPVFPTAGKSNPLAKSLSHLHLSLASIPAELAPPSRPSSPGSKARRQTVYDNIRAAYNAAGGQPSNTSWSQVYRLVDMTCTRSRFKKSATRVERKYPEKDIPWILAETEEEWAEWEKAREKLKSKLRRTDTLVVDQQGHSSASGAPSKQVNLRDKVTSWKAQIERSFHGEEDIIREPESSNPATTRSSQPSPTRKRVSPLDFPVIKPSTLKAHTDAKAKGKARQKTPKPPTKPDLPHKTDLGGRRSPTPEVPPHSTSDANRKPPFKRKEGTSEPLLIPPSHPQTIAPTPKERHIPADALPASSPPKAGTSRMPLLGLTTPESQEAQRAAAKKRFRPLSPPTTGEDPPDCDPPPSAKRQKTTTSPLRPTRRVSPLPLGRDLPVTPARKQGVFGSSIPTSKARKTPVRPLGAAEGFEDVGDVEIIGRVTPKKRERSLTPMLATSHKVMPLPRPSRNSSPLKKPRAPLETDDADDNRERMPLNSPKAYFTSPVSSTSSASTPRKNRGPPPLLALDHLNPNFTLNPEAFDPLYTSTQNGPEGDGSGGRGRILSRKGTGSSPGFKFNSQFDVDKKVEDALALLERDVDPNNWFVDPDGDVDLTANAGD